MSEQHEAYFCYTALPIRLFLSWFLSVVESSSDEERERAEKSQWEIFWDYLGRFFSKEFSSFLPSTITFSHISALGMLLSLSYTGIKIYPQSSNLLFKNFFLILFNFYEDYYYHLFGKKSWRPLTDRDQAEGNVSFRKLMLILFFDAYTFLWRKNFRNPGTPVKDISETDCERSGLTSPCRMEAYSGVRPTETWRTFPALLNLSGSEKQK